MFLAAWRRSPEVDIFPVVGYLVSHCYAAVMTSSIYNWIGLFVVSASLAGCSSPFGRSSAYSATPQQRHCIALNAGIADTAKGISRAGVTRANLNVPFWVPGGARAKSALQDRQAAKIDRLRQEQATLADARRRDCF